METNRIDGMLLVEVLGGNVLRMEGAEGQEQQRTHPQNHSLRLILSQHAVVVVPEF